MNKQPLYVVLLAVAISCTVVPQKADALGLIDMYCWYSNAPGVPLGSAPLPTVGCTFLWGPGGPAIVAEWSVLYGCLTSGCVVSNNPTGWSGSVANPTSGTKHRYIGANCTGQVVHIAVGSEAKSYRISISPGGDILHQSIEDTSGGPVAPFFSPLCLFPGGTGAVSVVP